MKINYLIVEDNTSVSETLVEELHLSALTGEVQTTTTGEEAVSMLKKNPCIDLMVLDYILAGDMHAPAVLTEARNFSNVKIIIWGKHAEAERQTETLRLGADAYMPKDTFKSALQIRNFLEAFMEKPHPDADVKITYKFDGWTLDKHRRQVVNSDGAMVSLRGQEFDLLLLFVENPQSILSQEEIAKHLVGMEDNKNIRGAIAQLVTRLRRKIDNKNAFILNVRGRGFQFTPDVKTVLA